MNEERIEGLEIMIKQFQNSLQKMKKKLRKLNETCSAAPQNSKLSFDTYKSKKPRNHCLDEKQIKRLNNEIWMQDDCTKCECQHHQISCTTEKCLEDKKCSSNMILQKKEGLCCHICVSQITINESIINKV